MILRPPLVIAAAMLMATGFSAAMSAAEVAPGDGMRHHRHAGPPPGRQSRKFHGGEGSSWKTGRNAYGFQGRYGGCQYVGGAGPNGYRINRVCR